MASAYLTSNTGTATNANKFTLSMWLKRSSLSGTTAQRFYQGYQNGNNRFYAMFDGTNSFPDRLWIYNVIGGATKLYWVSTRKFRDLNAWYHIVFSADSTQGTEADRFKVYINGVEETGWTKTNNQPQNINWGNQLAQTNNDLTISGTESQTQPFDGQIAHVNFIDGTAYAPTVFGETDATTGIWKPKTSPSVTYGNNGYFLKFDNSGNMGLDSSGENNNFTTIGSIIQQKDTPSNVYCTLNPLDFGGTSTSNASLSNVNMTPVSGSAAWKSVHGTLGMATGKWYWEAKQIGTGSGSTGHIYGICDQQYNTDDDPNNGTPNAKFYGKQGSIRYNNDSGTASFFTPIPSDGDIFMMAFNATDGKLWFGLNGTWQNSNGSANNVSYASTTLNPSYPDFTGLTVDTSKAGIYVPIFGSYGSGSMNVNFGNGFFGTTAITSAGSNGNGSLFEYDVPTGYYALNTKNLGTQS